MMNSETMEYKYQIEMLLNMGGSTKPIKIEQISGMFIDSAYDDNFMPIIMVQLSAGKQIIDEIIEGKVNNTIILTVRKFEVKENTFVEDYIKDEFLYYIMDDVSYTKKTEYRDQETKEMDDVLKKVKIGMLSLKISNKNKLMFNNVYTDVSNQCMALIATEKVGELVFEPMNDYHYDELLVPPIDNINDMLDYLNNRNTFYDTYYRFFMDFDRSYLLSSSGEGVETNDEPNNTVNINIYDPSEPAAYLEGVKKDDKKKCYIIPIDANYSRMYTNNAAEKHFNMLHGISSSGQVKDITVSINKANVSEDRRKNVRIPYENFGVLDNIRNSIEGESHILTVTKSNMDSSIITLNKHYVLNHYRYPSLNGDFILSRKVETFQRQGEYFVSECMMTFRSSKQLEK